MKKVKKTYVSATEVLASALKEQINNGYIDTDYLGVVLSTMHDAIDLAMGDSDLDADLDWKGEK
jgi:hypothetical protein